MRVVVISSKECWHSETAPSGFATDGGFALQMGAISELFHATTLLLPCRKRGATAGEIPLGGRSLRVVPLSVPAGRGALRKLALPFWLLRNAPVVLRSIWRADAVHTPIPSDVGTLGLLLALMFRKPLLVRHCGNWFVQATAAERFWKWLMERFAGGRNVMFATGGASAPPSLRNPHIRWIFSTSLREDELLELGSLQERDGRFGERLRLIIVCRQDREKGTGIVLESLPLLLPGFPALTLDVVGAGPDLDHFRARAAQLGVAERVTFHGRQDHDGVLRLLCGADLFCYPTRASEGFPKVVLEALASGLPVVTTRVSVLPELIGQGGGILLDGASPAALAAAVRDIMRDEETYRRMSYHARQVARSYSLERWRDTIAEALDGSWGKLRADA